MKRKKICHTGQEELHHCNDMSDCRYGSIDKKGVLEKDCDCYFSPGNIGPAKTKLNGFQDYMKRAQEICKLEFMSRMDLAAEIKISYPTLVRIEKMPATCSLKTQKKIKMFVDNWESKK